MNSSWISKRGFSQGVFWVLIGCLLSNANDILMKYTSSHLNPFQVVFFRSFLGLLITTPFFLITYKRTRPIHYQIHIRRVLIGTAAITLACYSTSMLPLPEVTALSFCQPLFLLPTAVIFLGEKLTIQRALSNILGFLGVLIVLNPSDIATFSIAGFVPVTSAFLFTILDIITKKSVDLEHPVSLIFYFNLGTALLTGMFSLFSWTPVSSTELIQLLLLGISATLIQLSSFLSLSSTSILSLAPLRYTELLFSCLFSMIIFKEPPTLPVILGSILIMGGVLYTSFNESSKLQTEG